MEYYLNMLKESRPNFVFEKRTEVISIEDADESNVESVLDDSVNKSESVVIVDDSFDETNCKKGPAKSNIEVIDLESFDDTNGFQNSQSPSKVVSDEIVVVETVKKDNANVMSFENRDLSKASQELSGSGVKRKKSIGTIIIEDDDIIVLDHSFKKPKHQKACSRTVSHQGEGNLTVTVKEDSKPIPAYSSQNSVIDLAISDENNSSCFFDRTDSLLPKSPCFGNDPKQSSIQVISTRNDNICSNIPKKPSKFSYKRPAHLTGPLTQKVSGSTEDYSKSSSSSGMSNIYNPNANIQEKRTGLRPIVIDGNNVGVR